MLIISPFRFASLRGFALPAPFASLTGAREIFFYNLFKNLSPVNEVDRA
ncbi:MAG: hypothetical protein VB027_06645 [Gordonibacter sp.]|nr:hypothetical protein [Gordonibacter sp.]